MDVPPSGELLVNFATQLIQSIVRATHDWPLLGSIYRSIYASAAASVARLAEAHPGIAAVYARNSYALGTWEPGRSDIDLTVVWDAPSPDAIHCFYRSYGRLKGRFPMLGEIEMLDARHLPAFSAYGLRGLESRGWKKLGGAHTFACRYAGNEQRDRLRHAVCIYYQQFLPKFWHPQGQESTLRRLAAKISRQINAPPPQAGDPAGLLTHCLEQLTAAIHALPAPPPALPVDLASLIGALSTPAPAPPPTHPFPLAVIAHSPDGPPRHVVTSNNLAAAARESRFQGATIMTPGLFQFYLTCVDPLEYFALLQDRFILEGHDPLHEPYPLHGPLLRETVCHYAVDMLTFPYRPELASLSTTDFENLLYGWFLRTLGYFEQDRFLFQYHLVREHFGDRHAESLPRYQLLRGIVEDVSSQMLT